MKITLDAVNEVLDRLVAEKGDTRFERNADGCFYRAVSPDQGAFGEPLCIVGHVFSELIPDVFKRIPVDRHGVNGTKFDIMVDRADIFGLVTFEDDARVLLDQAQFEQDSGADWRKAVAEARAVVARRQAHRVVYA